MKKILVVVLLGTCLINTYANLKEKEVMPFEASLIGCDISKIKKSGLLFKNLTPEKRGKILKYAQFPNPRLWDFTFLYSKNRIITTIAFLVQKDIAKAKKECPNVIKLLIKIYGKDYRVCYAKLSAKMSTEKGYCMIWNKDKNIIALKFGPLNMSAKKFYLELSISSDIKGEDKRLRIYKKGSAAENDKEILKELTDYFGDDIGITK